MSSNFELFTGKGKVVCNIKKRVFLEMAEAIKELSESQTYNVLQKAIRSKVSRSSLTLGQLSTDLDGPWPGRIRTVRI